MNPKTSLLDPFEIALEPIGVEEAAAWDQVLDRTRREIHTAESRRPRASDRGMDRPQPRRRAGAGPGPRARSDALGLAWENAGRGRVAKADASGNSAPKTAWSRFRVDRRSGVAIVTLLDASLVQESILDGLAAELEVLIASGSRRIVLNFAGVERLSSRFVPDDPPRRPENARRLRADGCGRATSAPKSPRSPP